MLLRCESRGCIKIRYELLRAPVAVGLHTCNQDCLIVNQNVDHIHGVYHKYHAMHRYIYAMHRHIYGPVPCIHVW